jgi:hypothetical protein
MRELTTFAIPTSSAETTCPTPRISEFNTFIRRAWHVRAQATAEGAEDRAQTKVNDSNEIMSMNARRFAVELNPALRVARGIAVAVTFCATAFLTVANAAEAVPSSTVTEPAGRTYAPREIASKRDPIDMIRRSYMSSDWMPDPHRLPGTFVIKFRDEVKARAGIKPSRDLGSLSGTDMSQARGLLAFYGGTFRQWIRKSEGELQQIESRARENSGRQQPDLAGMIQVAGVPTHRFIEATRAFSSLDMVEYVSIDLHAANLQAVQGCDPGNAQDCNVPACPIPFNCNPGQPDPIFGCNDPGCCNQIAEIDPTCNDEQSGNGWDVYCAALANQFCGPQVYELGTYDACFFAPGAPENINPDFFDVYYQIQQGGCASPHNGPGCSNAVCCAAVCTIDPSCCSASWDASCADMVRAGMVPECNGVIPPPPTTDVSPDLTAQETGLGLQGFQFYTQSQRRGETLTPVIPGSTDTWPSQLGQSGNEISTQFGFSGQGFALKEMNDFQNLIWEYYQSGDPAENPYLNGNGVRIAAIESSAYVQHEDFVLAGPPKNPTQPWEGPLLGMPKVIAEENQSPLFIEDGRISANHGTNVLGVMIAADNGIGITGMAPDAQGYFYPTHSIEDGFRAQDAIASCLQEFTQGDVMNFSWGFQDGDANIGPYFAGAFTELNTPSPNPITLVVQPVTSVAAYWQLIRTASDLGIACVLANGQGPRPCQSAGLGDSGAIIVSASYPGSVLPGTVAPGRGAGPGYSSCQFSEDTVSFLRFPSSNFDGEEAAGDDDASSDVTAWGFGVATTGGTTERRNAIQSNPQFFLFQGVNNAPPTGTAPELQVDQLRGYTDRFGGTSAAAAMISGLVARIQGASRQFYGMPLATTQLRTLMQTAPGSFAQCYAIGNGEPSYEANDAPFFSQGLLATGTADSCLDTANGCVPIGCTCERHPIASMPNLVQMTPAILSIPGFGGNGTDADVITGSQLAGYSWSSFQVRAQDGNILRIGSVRMNAGTQREGLAYPSAGQTTDIRVSDEIAEPNPDQTVFGLGLRFTSRATRNFVMAGFFVKNWRRNRYEYFDAEILPVQLPLFPTMVTLPDLPSFADYVQAGTNKVEMRMWTCGLGSTGRHIVDHDLIEIVVNPNMIPGP